MLSDEEERQESKTGQHPGAWFRLFRFFCISYITDSSDNDRAAIKNAHRGESGPGKDEASVSPDSTSK